MRLGRKAEQDLWGSDCSQNTRILWGSIARKVCFEAALATKHAKQEKAWNKLYKVSCIHGFVHHLQHPCLPCDGLRHHCLVCHLQGVNEGLVMG